MRKKVIKFTLIKLSSGVKYLIVFVVDQGRPDFFLAGQNYKRNSTAGRKKNLTNFLLNFIGN